MKKRFLSIILVLSMLMAFIPTIVNAETSGTCGIKVNWTLDDNGILTISGTGDMSYFSTAPWYDKRSSITSVVIESGVTSIGDNSFSYCSNLASITIPNSITSIGNYAFWNCENLTSISIPDTVTSIGERAFCNCESLTSISIPDSVISIGQNAFESCQLLENIEVDTNNPNYSSLNGNLFDKDKHTIIQYMMAKNDTKYTIPNSVRNIDNYAFEYCDNLTSVTIPNSVNSIGAYAFRECNSLTSIIIPDSVNNIGTSAFNKCSNLANISIPDGVTSISGAVFDGTAYYKDEAHWTDGVLYIGNHLIKANSSKINSEYIIKDGTKTIAFAAFSFCENLKSVTLPNSITRIDNRVFGYCSKLSDITIPKSVISIGEEAFYDCSKLTNIYYNGTEEQWNSIILESGNEALENATIHYNNTPTDPLEYLTYTISHGEVWITGCDDRVTEVIIPNEINGFPVTEITMGAFRDCTNLTKITIPDTIIAIAQQAFYNTAYYNDASNWQEGVLYIGNYLIEAKPDEISSEYTVKDGTITIAEKAFYGCKNLTSITIPEGVISINTNAFWDCENLADISISDSVKYIESSIFQKTAYYNEASNWTDGVLYIDNHLIEAKPNEISSNYIIKDGTTSIADVAFWNCKNLTSIDIPNSVASIGGNAFSGCRALTSVEIPEKVTVITGNLFRECESLTNVKLPEGITIIDSSAFWGCSGLATVNIPESVTVIGEMAFYCCFSLTDINLPSNIISIGDIAFAGTPYYEDETNWVDGVLYLNNYLIAVDYTKINSQYTIKDGTKVLADKTFRECGRLTTIVIPDSVTNIGRLAFEWAPLTDVYYTGTKAQWDSMFIGQRTDGLQNATIHYNYVQTKPSTYTINKIENTNTGVSLTVQPNEEVGGEQTVLVACYDEDGKFAGLQQKQIKALEGEQEIDFTLEKEDVSLIKAFIWNAIDYLMPASQVKTLELN